MAGSLEHKPKSYKSKKKFGNDYQVRNDLKNKVPCS